MKVITIIKNIIFYVLMIILKNQKLIYTIYNYHNTTVILLIPVSSVFYVHIVLYCRIFIFTVIFIMSIFYLKLNNATLKFKKKNNFNKEEYSRI